MSLEEEKKNNGSKARFAIAALILIVLGLILLILYLLFGKTSYTTSSSQNTSAQSLYCSTKSKSVPDAFFDLTDAMSPEQKIKVVFSADKIDSISYDATIKYGDQEIAKKKEAELGVRYGLYMQENGREMSDFSPNFSTVGDEVRINLFAKSSQLNPTLARVFLINLDDGVTLSNLNLDTLYNSYSKKDFRCEKNE